MQVRKSHIVKNDARMYYGNICNSFILLILYHIVALLENEIMEDHVADFMPWFLISQFLSSEKTQDANFPDGVGKWRLHRFPRMSALKLLEIRKIFQILPMSNESIISYR